MNGRFNEKVVLITGGSSGIGRAAALAFAREGARIVVASRRETESDETLALVRQSGGIGTFVKTDVALASDVEALTATVVREHGRIDCAFNNAGIEGTHFVPTAEYSEETWDQVMNVNLKGVWLCMKYEIREMLKNGAGAIVNMSSIAGLVGSMLGAAYSASKHGVIGLTRTAALEYASKGIRINAVCPAVIRTAMAERAFFRDATLGDRVIARHPMARVGTPEEVAEAVLWLCSDSASFVTGAALPIDGGYLAQ
jgi:NAD(P)-dependent dehydrogenase (short-subunit alcohol dehydrogenase family)